MGADHEGFCRRANEPTEAGTDHRDGEAQANSAGSMEPSIRESVRGLIVEQLGSAQTRGGTVTIEIPRAADLRKIVDYLDGAVAWANQWYGDNVLPRIHAAAARTANADTAWQAEIERARQIAEGL
jgi:hypothetical protein